MPGSEESAPGGLHRALSVILTEAQFPAEVWQLVAHAHSWGAPASCVDQLIHLPAVTYRDQREVLVALGAVAPTGPGGSGAPDAPPRPARPRRWEDVRFAPPAGDMF